MAIMSPQYKSTTPKHPSTDLSEVVLLITLITCQNAASRWHV
jgi:hypothetical protein